MEVLPNQIKPYIRLTWGGPCGEHRTNPTSGMALTPKGAGDGQVTIESDQKKTSLRM